MISGHGGNIYALAAQLGCQTEEIVDMSSNINPLGPPPVLLSFLKARLASVAALPEVDARGLVRAFARWHELDPASVLAGNGTTQFIYSIPNALASGKVLIVGPTYADYADACRMHHVPFAWHPCSESNAFMPELQTLARELHRYDTVFLCNPNNPTGGLVPGSSLEAFCRDMPQVRFIIDESYLPFAPDGDRESMLGPALDNVIVLHSMSKIFGIPGLRIGFVSAAQHHIEALRRYELPWNVNALAQLAVTHLLRAEPQTLPFIEHTRAFIGAQMGAMSSELEAMDHFKPFPSLTSFILVRLAAPLTAENLCQHIGRKRILLRNCANFRGLSSQFIRISLKAEQHNQRLCRLLRAIDRHPEQILAAPS